MKCLRLGMRGGTFADDYCAGFIANAYGSCYVGVLMSLFEFVVGGIKSMGVMLIVGMF